MKLFRTKLAKNSFVKKGFVLEYGKITSVRSTDVTIKSFYDLIISVENQANKGQTA